MSMGLWMRRRETGCRAKRRSGVTLRGFLRPLFFLVVIANITQAQEAEYERAKVAEVKAEVPVQWAPATDGSVLGVTLTEPGWGACRNERWFEQRALRGTDQWWDYMDEQEAKAQCVTTGDDLVIVGPSDIAGALSIRFRIRKDVSERIVWYIACEALPSEVAEEFCYYD